MNRRLDTISIVAFDRQTLCPSVLFKEDDNSGGSTKTTLTTTLDGGYLRIIADIDRSMYRRVGGDNTSVVIRLVYFLFRRDAFELAFSTTAGADVGAL